MDMAQNMDVDLNDAVTDSPVEQEKMLSQSQVNKIVQKAKEAAAQKARREAEEEYNSQVQNLAQAQQSATPSQQFDIDKAYAELQERFNKEQQQKQFEREMQVVADKYLGTVEQAKNQFQDFDEIMADFDAQEFPEIVVLLSNIENAPDVLYELGKNSSKLANIDYWAKRSPRTAEKELRKLSQSIKANNEALAEANNNKVSAPLDRLQTSNVSSSNGKRTISDLRNADWLRV